MGVGRRLRFGQIRPGVNAHLKWYFNPKQTNSKSKPTSSKHNSDKPRKWFSFLANLYEFMRFCTSHGHYLGTKIYSCSFPLGPTIYADLDYSKSLSQARSQYLSIWFWRFLPEPVFTSILTY